MTLVFFVSFANLQFPYLCQMTLALMGKFLLFKDRLKTVIKPWMSVYVGQSVWMYESLWLNVKYKSYKFEIKKCT